ncbi:MAG: hypothetical protein KJ906_02055 [Nanoarchaeota archaeon]|nr:hypothetical protein [Nanoarchaeota archaeon]
MSGTYRRDEEREAKIVYQLSQIKAAGRSVFTPNELREFMGYEPRKELENTEVSQEEEPQDIIPPFWAQE